MRFRWVRRRRSRRVRRGSEAHYQAHKEEARAAIASRLAYWNQFYGHAYHRVAIRNQVSRWGCCSAKGNLNFNYRLIFLPTHLMDYVIVHELCHLKHFNHSRDFWALVGTRMPEYDAHRRELKLLALDMYKKPDLLHTS